MDATACGQDAVTSTSTRNSGRVTPDTMTKVEAGRRAIAAFRVPLFILPFATGP
jgi:hypothetical protein